MNKRFLEVFPGLKIADPLKELLDLVQVEKITSTRDRSSIRIYLNSPRLIHKKNIYDLERGIKEQLFPEKQLTIKIQERYRLSGQYTPEKLMQAYRDSLLLELKHYSIIEYTMFRKAEISFEGEGRMILSIEDTMVNRDKMGELKRVIEKVFAERCGLPVEVDFAFVPAEGSKRRQLLEQKIEREAQAIYARNHRDELGAAGGAAYTGGQQASDSGEAYMTEGAQGAPWDALMGQAAQEAEAQATGEQALETAALIPGAVKKDAASGAKESGTPAASKA